MDLHGVLSAFEDLGDLGDRAVFEVMEGDGLCLAGGQGAYLPPEMVGLCWKAVDEWVGAPDAGESPRFPDLPAETGHRHVGTDPSHPGHGLS
jgi:hypothetical protein